ncbi:hypothetical protein FB459_1879 [Yimella lutea]|uniref:Uncharacterized protein n=1 Tax=Yimella lutea TaxID=587872 RepID=A0A542EGH9_9MICO|nr:hypothetical protein [Yimella lutea]TQJ14419.1 hypothetical protein FB459_1879 [Yimella lutea]
MTTVDPSGALHDAKGRFAGHVAGESGSTLQDEDLEHLRATLSGSPVDEDSKTDGPVGFEVAATPDGRRRQREHLRQMTDRLDTQAISDVVCIARSSMPNVRSISVARATSGSPWSLDGVYDDSYRYLTCDDESWQDIDSLVRELDPSARWAQSTENDDNYFYASLPIPQGATDDHR